MRLITCELSEFSEIRTLCVGVRPLINCIIRVIQTFIVSYMTTGSILND